MTDEKIEWRKEEAGFSLRKKPQILTIPAQNYFSIKGNGDPNLPDFQKRVQTLYPLSYTIRMSQKNDWNIPNFKLYTVYPLQGHWGIQPQYLDAPVMQKDHFTYTISIKQPDFVTDTIAAEALVRAKSKIDADLFDQVFFDHQPEQLAAQILHVGAFDDESESFTKLEQFIDEAGYVRSEKEHTEIYMSDFRRVEEAHRKTILRVAIQKK
ncbi:GyrI-like domain-containing protein [Pediococcus pentosaceus]|uniref:GyrI-like domain-containing protein n=1 Tax=Pediococcus pentosaceus TaxID=1255 RepID=UPI00200EB811|nr:GyrI-like domain-containing protein [Pediococcus pentosaceus]UQB01057.1 GyrI-like domain-containing protein [Pediococcus pentosaceus]UQB02906.1 GyrI-like domain-containing protein [Pediococcus pentosaceus]